MSYTRSVLVTGGTVGLGFQCAREIARAHPEYLLVVASRSDPNSAADSINKSLGQKNVQYLPLDLSSQAKIRSFAKTWEARKFPPLSTLILNAGLQFPFGLRKNEDGIEATFGINHVGHALLFYLLLPHLAEDKVRVVLVASGTHDPAQKTGFPDAEYITAEQVAHPPPEAEKIDGRQRYSTSKLTNIMWTYALHRRFASVQGKKMTVAAFDPGLMPGTGLGREYPAIFRWGWVHIVPFFIPLIRRFILHNTHTAAESGASLAWFATSPVVEDVSGEYYEGRKPIKSSVASYDEKKQEDLWEWTIKNTALSEEEISKFEKAN